jgi:methylenetetrahydrofolate reductase (NADPH)
VQTQFVFDLDIFERFMAEVRDLGITEKCGVIAGVGPVRSLRALEYISTKVPGIHVPDAMVRRLRGVPAARVADEGMQICVEIIQRLTEISGVAGAHVMAFGYEQGIPEILERAGVGPRPDRSVANDRAANDRANDRAANEGSGRAG